MSVQRYVPAANAGDRSQLRGAALSSRFLSWSMMAYVHLWIVEGLLRKAISPLNEVIYFGRDGLAILAILVAIAYGRLHRTQVLGGVICVFIVLWTCLSAIGGVDPVGVWIVGVRSYIAPLLFVMLFSMCGTESHRQKILTLLIAYLPVQAAIVIVQVTSPASSFWNMQTTGEEAHFLNDGIARASGSFSAPAGLFGYVLLAAAIALATMVSSRGRRRLLASTGVMAAIGIASLSGSRGTALILLILVSGLVVWVAFNGSFQRFVLVGFIALATILSVYIVSVSFPEVLDSFGGRIQDASQHEDTSKRIAFTMFGFIEGLDSLFGMGAGHNSQAGIAVGSGGEWIENESLRWVVELGAFGLLLALLRLGCALLVLIGISVRLTAFSPQRFMLTLAIGVVLLQGTITQNPSSQGAFSIMLALFFAARDRRTPTETAQGTVRNQYADMRKGLGRRIP